MSRPRLLPAVLAVALLGLALVGESMLPGRVLLPLTPGDLPAWRADGEVPGHPAPNWTMSDALHLFVPGLAVTGEAFGRGALPLWDPSQALGLPHHAQVHYGVLYPPAWLPLILGWDGLAVMAWLHLLVGGIGLAAWLAAVGRSPMAAATGGVAFAGSAWFVARLHAFPVAGALAWVPWILWGLERGGRARAVAAAAVALSILAGFPQVALWGLVVAGVLSVVSAVQRGRGDGSLLAALGADLATVALGLALAAVQVLPTLDYMRHESARTGLDAEQVAGMGLEPPHLAHLLVPDLYAAAQVPGFHPLALESVSGSRQAGAFSRPEVSMSVGVVALVLAVAGAIGGRGARRVVMAALAVVCLALLVWPDGLRVAATVLPVLRFGSPLRLLAVSTLALAVLASEGVDALVAGRRSARRVALVAAAVAAVLGLACRATTPTVAARGGPEAWAASLAEAVGHPELPAADVLALVPPERMEAATEAARESALEAAVAGLVLVVLLLVLGRIRRERWAAWLLVAVALELALAGRPLLRPAPEAGLTGDLGYEPPSLVRAVRAAGAPSRVPPRLVRLGEGATHLRSNLPVLFDLADLQAYAPMAPRRVVELLSTIDPGVASTGSAIWGFVEPAALERPVVDLLVDVVLTSEDVVPAGFRRGATAGGVSVLVNTEALPHAVWVEAGGARVVADRDERLAAVAAEGFAPRDEVLLARWPAGTGIDPPAETPSAVPPMGRPAPPRALEIVSWEPGRMRCRLAPGAPGWVVVAETWHRGWRATAGGRPVPVVEAQGALIGVPVASRDAVDVTLVYAPPAFVHGLAVSGLAVLAWLAVLMAGRSRR